MIKSATNWSEFQALIQRASAGTHIDPEIFAGLTVNDLIELDGWAGVPEGTSVAEPENPKLQTYMQRSLRVINEMLLIGLQPDKALFWFRNFPVSELNNMAPRQLLKDDHASTVIAKLQQVFKAQGDTLGKLWDRMREDTIHLEEELVRRVRTYNAFDVAKLCGVAVEGRREFLLARELARRGTMFYFLRHKRSLFPAYQFNESGPKPVVKQVLDLLSPHLSGFEIALWFSAPNGWLDGEMPEELMDSDPELVMDAAKQEMLPYIE